MVERTELTFEQMQKGAAVDVAAYAKKCMEPIRCHECGSNDLERTCDVRVFQALSEYYDNGEWSSPE